MVRWASSTSTKTFSRWLIRGDAVELVDHRDDQPPPVGLEQLLQVFLALGHLDLAEADCLQVAEELGFQLVPVHEHQTVGFSKTGSR